MALANLPFDISELSWDKLDVVATHLNLRKADAFDVLTKILGPRPSGPLEIWLHSFPKTLIEYIASVLLSEYTSSLKNVSGSQLRMLRLRVKERQQRKLREFRTLQRLKLRLRKSPKKKPRSRRLGRKRKLARRKK